MTLAHEALMQFLHHAPLGLVRTTPTGEIVWINPRAAQLLAQLSGPPGGEAGVPNLFDALQACAPQLRAAAAASPPGAEVCCDLPLWPAHDAAGQAAAPRLRLQRLDADTLMASLSAPADTAAAPPAQAPAATEAAPRRDPSRIDALTTLPNRSVALERIEAALQRTRDDPSHRFAVLFINGDRFNRVNVSLGPAAGDALLRLMAARVSGAVRQRGAVGPANGALAARLGVDEFVVVLEGVPGSEMVAAVAQRLVESLSRPYVLGAAPVHSSASVGVALCPSEAGDAEAVLQDASLAMREAKRSGGARYCVFEPRIKERAWRRASLESELRQALQHDQLFVVFQPIVQLADGHVAGVEALVRWRHPQRGVVPPLEFIEIAEETGLIVPVGAFVLQAACRQLAAWQRALGTSAPDVMSVNLSRAQLAEATLVDVVRQAVRSSGIAPACLQLEITESQAAENPQIQARLHELKALGVMLALDDFGTGHSSLSSLHQWPVDVIKIDRSFVSQIDSSAHHRVLVEATVRVARSLGMATVAEGVETTRQAEVLAALQCDKVQGYLYARPLIGDEAARWLLEHQPQAVAAPAGPLPLRAELAEALLQRLEDTHTALALFDPQERLAWANHSFRAIHWQGLDGTPTWEDIMRTAHARGQGVMIDTPDIDAWLAGVRQRYRQQPRRTFESDLADGRWMRVTEETSAEGWQLCVSSDVTTLKVNEAELRRARDAALVASITDPLTGLPNRRHVFARLATLMNEAAELRLPLTVAVIDVDLFKQINDRHGHGVGDRVLVAFAQRLGATLRPRDVVGRIGGEEFLLVLMNTGRAGAERVLGELRVALHAQAVVAELPQLAVGFSAGITVAQPGDSADGLWQRADRGLYAAKAAGRGRDVFIEPPDAAAAVLARLRATP